MPIKKKTAKKAKSAKKATTKKPAVKKIGKIDKPFTKTAIIGTIAEQTELSRQQVAAVFDSLSEIIAAHLKKGSPEKFILPGLLKIMVKNIPAKPARNGVNPFTKEPMKFKAKPASKKVKVLPLKMLKEMC
jgi:nucleoid DNA-binding protein